MTLAVGEFMRRFLLHVLPPRFHRIRHYGLLASTTRRHHLARARELLALSAPPLIALPATADEATGQDAGEPLARLCPCCGGTMIIIETFQRGYAPRAPPSPLGETP